MTFSISIWRKGLKHDPNGPQDPGVTSGRATIDTTAPGSTASNVQANVKRAFVQVFGEDKVTGSSEPMEYLVIWNEEHQIWTLICVEKGTITIDDGQAEPLIVEITITV